MNIDEIVKHIHIVANELYPDNPEVGKLCKELITWERENISKITPRYKDKYRKILEDAVKRTLKD